MSDRLRVGDRVRHYGEQYTTEATGTILESRFQQVGRNTTYEYFVERDQPLVEGMDRRSWWNGDNTILVERTVDLKRWFIEVILQDAASHDFEARVNARRLLTMLWDAGADASTRLVREAVCSVCEGKKLVWVPNGPSDAVLAACPACQVDADDHSRYS